MVKWTEVNAYSGMPVDEDAPTNATGAAVSTDVPIVRKKKKKTFLDARTKTYKEHQKKLEAARARREERRKQAAKINEGQLDEREKGIDQLPRQFLNPSKEVMVVKKGKVIVIDKKDQDRYTKQGWELAEVLDKEDEPKVKEIVKKLKGASKAHAGQAKDLEKAVSETTITGKDLLENKYKEEKNGAQHFSKIEEDNYVWNFVYDDFGRTKLTTEPDKATHLVYTMEGKDNPQLLKISEKEILDYKKGETNEVSKK